jgi:hypothetical protein
MVRAYDKDVKVKGSLYGVVCTGGEHEELACCSREREGDWEVWSFGELPERCEVWMLVGVKIGEVEEESGMTMDL